MFSSLYYADMIKTSTLLPYDSIEVNENLVLYVDKDITLTSLWGRASDGNKVNFYDVVILPVGKHTITIDARTLSGNVKSALISKDLIIHDGVNLKILSNDKGIDCKGELTIGKADVLIQCVNTNAYYGAFYVESTKFNFLESEIVEPKGANIYQYTVYDPSTHDTAMKVRIAPKGTNTVIKKANPMTVQAKKVKIKASKLAKKKQTIKPASISLLAMHKAIWHTSLLASKRRSSKSISRSTQRTGTSPSRRD